MRVPGANAVRMYLVKEGLNPSTVTATGFGKGSPVADNSTSTGRQMNHRVELVVSGAVIGSAISTTRTTIAVQ